MLSKQNFFGKRDEVGANHDEPRRDPRDTRFGAYAPTATAPAAKPAPAVAGAVAPSPDKPADAAPAAAVSPATAAESSARGSLNRLTVGPEVKLKGAEILDCDTLVVEGRVEATMDSRVINIAENGSFSGKVGIDVADIHGSFEGELTARSQLIIRAGGRVNGKIRYGRILIEEGGEVSGDVRSLSAEADAVPVLRNTVAAVDLLKSKTIATLS